jgi:hypothetical protein
MHKYFIPNNNLNKIFINKMMSYSSIKKNKLFFIYLTLIKIFCYLFCKILTNNITAIGNNIKLNLK